MQMALCAKLICKMANGDHLHAGDSTNLKGCIDVPCTTLLKFLTSIHKFHHTTADEHGTVPVNVVVQ